MKPSVTTWSIKNKGGSRSKMSKNLDTLNWIVPPNSWITLLLANCIKSSKFILGTLFRRFGSAWWWGAPTSAFSIASFKWFVLPHQKCFQILNMVEGKIISREGEVTLDYFPRFLEADVRNVLLLILFSRSRSSLPEKNKKGSNFQVKLYPRYSKWRWVSQSSIQETTTFKTERLLS